LKDISVNEAEDWIETVTSALPDFLDRMRDPLEDGRFKYSLSGDLDFGERWGLGNAVFATKIFYMLGTKIRYPRSAIASFIQSFQNTEGEIFDPLVSKKAVWHRSLYCFVNQDMNDFSGSQTRRAESRQALAALRALQCLPEYRYQLAPSTVDEVKKYVHSLTWKKPWSAGSHFGHMIFFLKGNEWMTGRELADSSSEKMDKLIAVAFDEVGVYRQENGAWFQNGTSPSTAEQVSGAMKIITGYIVAERSRIGKEEELIDLCLALTINPDACNNFNLVLVLYYASRNTDYRRSDIYQFCLNTISRYKCHYWPEAKGFSFFIGRSIHRYYGAKLTRGLPEPDIHGTHLYLWGMVLIARLLELPIGEKLRPPVT
jgi:hypothetical protein